MKLQNLSLHLALFTIMISGPLMGAWHVRFIFGLLLTSLFALGLHCLYKVHTNHTFTTDWLVILPAISILFTFSMIVPLPVPLHAILSPDSSADLQHAYALLGQTPSTFFLSLAPRETALRGMQLLTALALFLVISDQTKHPEAQKTIENWILIGAFLFLLMALDHQPLENHNHVARIFGIFSLLCVAVFRPNEGAKTYAFGLAAILSGAAVYTTQSRWGMISFTLCLLIFRKSWRLGLGILALGLFIASGLIWDRLATLTDPTTYWGKIELLQWVPDLLRRHWLSGIGPGALSIEFHKNVQPNFHANPLLTYYYWVTHLENTTLQTLVDHGLIKGLILWALAIWAFVLVAKTNWRLAPVFLFVWIGDFSDFAFESGTVLYLCTLALALCPIDLKLRVSPQKLSSVFAGSLALGILATFMVFGRTHVNYLNPAYAYAQPKTEAWLKYALTRRPTHYPAHVMLARLYWNRHDYEQAFAEYRLAAASKPDSLAGLLEEIAPIAPTLEERQKILPDNSPAALEVLCKPWIEKALAEKDPEEAMMALETLLGDQSPDGQAAAWFAQILAFQKSPEAALSQSTGWEKELTEPCPFLNWRFQTLKPEQALREFDHIKPCLNDWEVQRADLYERSGQTAKALEIFTSLVKANPSDTALAARKNALAKSLHVEQ